ncbi:hypothetical protein [Elizabethkingia anophelis]|uniref:hypothetical protein n=1 Tax=Elizabethkingia anophelis TaxID=1117645 RepID=UPI00293C7C43|nr:hypothetical protein [Elizabethkingia anophelis]
MKKFLLVAAIGVAGIMSAAAPTKNDVKENQQNYIKEAKAFIYDYEYGYGAVDTPNGTCFVYGKYVYLEEDHNYYTFTPAPRNSYVGMDPICADDGNYYV